MCVCVCHAWQMPRWLAYSRTLLVVATTSSLYRCSEETQLLQDGEKVRTSEEVRGYEYEPPSEQIQFMTNYVVNRLGTVQVRRYAYEPPCPPPQPCFRQTRTSRLPDTAAPRQPQHRAAAPRIRCLKTRELAKYCVMLFQH